MEGLLKEVLASGASGPIQCQAWLPLSGAFGEQPVLCISDPQPGRPLLQPPSPWEPWVVWESPLAACWVEEWSTGLDSLGMEGQGKEGTGRVSGSLVSVGGTAELLRALDTTPTHLLQ